MCACVWNCGHATNWHRWSFLAGCNKSSRENATLCYLRAPLNQEQSVTGNLESKLLSVLLVALKHQWITLQELCCDANVINRDWQPSVSWSLNMTHSDHMYQRRILLYNKCASPLAHAEGVKLNFFFFIQVSTSCYLLNERINPRVSVLCWINQKVHAPYEPWRFRVRTFPFQTGGRV